MKKYKIQNRETGTVIENNLDLITAKELMEQYYESDKTEGIYVADFYEIAEED